jgi:hypothetical protein
MTCVITQLDLINFYLCKYFSFNYMTTRKNNNKKNNKFMALFLNQIIIKKKTNKIDVCNRNNKKMPHFLKTITKSEF